MSSIRHKTTKLTKQNNSPIMATLKRPLEITLDSLHPNRAPPKKRRQYYEQLHQIELYHNIKNSKQNRLKKYQRRERVKFALFLKYLVHYLFFTDQDKYKKAKQIVLDCTKLQREGMLGGLPLMSAVKGRLYGLARNEYEHCDEILKRFTKICDFHL